MCGFPLIEKLTAWTSRHSLNKYVWLTLFLLTAVAYTPPVLAQDNPIKSIQSDKKERITGAFGIKLGEDMGPYIEGHYAGYSMYVPGLESVSGNLFTYINLKPPVDLKSMFPDSSQLKLMGIRDDKNRTIVLHLQGYANAECEQARSPNVIRELLRQKYKITKPVTAHRNTHEEYGDSEGNSIRMDCQSRTFTVTYKSHLFKEYVDRIFAELKKQQEDIKGNLLKKDGL
ncbi:MAG: hypothetical protein NTV58_01250 [Deltaproteobacteria bacterium]|nr:hypothetical protein [Deltaproteobacteria bacterium]